MTDFDKMMQHQGIIPAEPGYTAYVFDTDAPQVAVDSELWDRGSVIAWLVGPESPQPRPITEVDGLVNTARLVIRRPNGTWYFWCEAQILSDESEVMKLVYRERANWKARNEKKKG